MVKFQDWDMWLFSGVSHDFCMVEAAAGGMTLVWGLHNEILSKKKQSSSSTSLKGTMEDWFPRSPTWLKSTVAELFITCLVYIPFRLSPVLDCAASCVV